MHKCFTDYITFLTYFSRLRSKYFLLFGSTTSFFKASTKWFEAIKVPGGQPVLYLLLGESKTAFIRLYGRNCTLSLHDGSR